MRDERHTVSGITNAAALRIGEGDEQSIECPPAGEMRRAVAAS
jgi:hypothetical protein